MASRSRFRGWDESRDGELIEVVFRAQIFSFGTVFSGRVYDSARPLEVPQVVTEGEVDELVEGNTLSVGLADIGGDIIGAFRLLPAVITPNGDGVKRPGAHRVRAVERRRRCRGGCGALRFERWAHRRDLPGRGLQRAASGPTQRVGRPGRGGSAARSRTLHRSPGGRYGPRHQESRADRLPGLLRKTERYAADLHVSHRGGSSADRHRAACGPG